MVTTLQIVTAGVWTIIGFKLIFISSTLLHKYVNYNKDSIFYKYDDKLVYIRELTEFIFIGLMCALMIFVFHPRKDHMEYMNKEIKLLMYLFGWVILVTADWSGFRDLITKQKTKSE